MSSGSSTVRSALSLTWISQTNREVMVLYEYEEIFPEELEKWQRDGAQLVDVRERWEYELGHIPDANNIPLGELPGRVDELQEPVVLVCASGNRSGQAAHYLTEHGIFKTVANLVGGTTGWQARGLPVV